jgi:hypothetical protein
LQSQNYSFVVRVWLESTYGDGKVAIWRGSIEQVGGNSRIYFSDLEGITRFIQEQIYRETPPPPSRWRLALEFVQNGFKNLWKHLRG